MYQSCWPCCDTDKDHQIAYSEADYYLHLGEIVIDGLACLVGRELELCCSEPWNRAPNHLSDCERVHGIPVVCIIMVNWISRRFHLPRAK
jgi:hypothetical protein